MYPILNSKVIEIKDESFSEKKHDCFTRNKKIEVRDHIHKLDHVTI